MTYTSNSYEDILSMPYIVFKNLIEGIGKKINWEMKVQMASSSPEFGNTISEKDFPLSSNEEVEEGKVFRMSDAMALQNLSNN